ASIAAPSGRFFFQAEDGIRDKLVTGVQTCALPILTPAPPMGAHFAELPLDSITPNSRQPREVFDEDALQELVTSIQEVGLLQPRSEERRVGKEWRSRGTRVHGKENRQSRKHRQLAA